MQIIWVFIGGGIGSILRYGLGELTKKIVSLSFPISTLVVNVIACLALGVIITMLRDRIQQSDHLYYLLVIGLCGGFSTFSAFANDTVELLRRQAYIMAASYVILSVAMCVYAVAITRK